MLKTKFILIAILVAALSLQSTQQSYATGSPCNPILTVSPLTATNPVGGSHTVTGTYTTEAGCNTAGLAMGFQIVSGPNTGPLTICATTGTTPSPSPISTCTFTYTDSGGAGTDTINVLLLVTPECLGSACITPVTKTWSGTGPGEPHECPKGFHFDTSTNQCVPNIQSPVGGEILSIDMTSLFVAGAMTNAFWVLPTVGGIAGTAIVLFKVKRKHI